jgi:hypothetical protein
LTLNARVGTWTVTDMHIPQTCFNNFAEIIDLWYPLIAVTNLLWRYEHTSQSEKAVSPHFVKVGELNWILELWHVPIFLVQR